MVRIKGQSSKGDTIVGVSYRPPDWEGVDEPFYTATGPGSWGALTTLTSSGKAKQQSTSSACRRFQESTGDFFLSHIVEDPIRNAGLPDLILTNREGLVGHVMVGQPWLQ